MTLRTKVNTRKQTTAGGLAEEGRDVLGPIHPRRAAACDGDGRGRWGARGALHTRSGE